MKDNSQLLVKAAQLYYDSGVNQSDIANILGVSRPTVSRLLDKAREEGIVEIIVHDPIDKGQELSNQLREAFGLRDAVVITGNYDYEKALERCCEAAIQFMDQILQDGDSIGVAWGSVPRIICRTMKPRDYSNITVVQMVGSLGTGDTDVDGTRIAMRLAQLLGGTYCNIYSPIYVHKREVCEYLCEEPSIAATLERAMHTDVIITGIGSLDNKTTIQRAGYWLESDMDELRRLGAVGHLLGRPYDKTASPSREMVIT